MKTKQMKNDFFEAYLTSFYSFLREQTLQDIFIECYRNNWEIILYNCKTNKLKVKKGAKKLTKYDVLIGVL